MPDDNDVLTAPTVHTLEGSSTLFAEVLDNGALRRLEAFGTSLLLHPATVAEAGLTNVHLRVHRPDGPRRRALLGPGSGSVVTAAEGAVVVTGRHEGLDYRLVLTLGDGSPETPTWHWDLVLTNTTGEPVIADAVLTHDPALAPLGNVRINEYYVSQYLDLAPVATDGHGTAVAVRQNMPGERVPWLMVGTTGRGTGWATDALQLTRRTGHGVDWPGLDAVDLPSERLQHEHSLIALQDAPVEIAPADTHRTGFWGIALEDHPAATSDADARWADVAVAATPTPWAPAGDGAHGRRATPATLWSSSPAFASRPLDRTELDDAGLLDGRTEVETGDDGTELAWTVRGGQLVTSAKELAVLRPHGHLLRTGDTFTPDSRSLASTVWMAGTFHSQITRGHVGRDPLVTGRRTYLGLQRAHGVRLFVEDADGTWSLLETPSAWFTGLDHCTWWYAAASGPVLTVTSSAPAERHALTLAVGQRGAAPRRILLALQVADDLSDAPSVTTADDHVDVTTAGDPRPWRISWTGPGDPEVGDARLQADGVGRGPGWVTVLFDPSDQLEVVVRSAPGAGEDATGEVRPTGERLGAAFWDRAGHAVTLDGSALGEAGPQAGNLSAALPWFTHNAFVHYLSPRGLEQFSGGAWGTRDVCQGPVGLLTALGRQDAVRDVLLRVFRAQNARGDWPQAFEFLPPLPETGQQDSHGDVVFWPVLAAGDYLRTSGDASLLDETVAFVGDDALGEPATVAEHLRRAVARIAECTVPGSPLPAYGHGDWNDSLQPADPHLAAHLVSTWTAVLQTQSLRTLAEGLHAVGAPHGTTAVAADADELAERTHDALLDQLAADPVLPGYLLQHEDGHFEPLVHPTDERTGLRYGVLPWIHAIGADLLTPEQARHHLDLIEEHLLGPDGARLFDRPVSYVGGPMAVFQRAEASTFWGREIGLMYMHAHLRYAEALARVGDGAALLTALAKASPVGLDALVPQARPRQTTCYYSSSDGAFTDRYDASERYAALMAGDVPLEGGWRVYSSGPGLVLRLVTEVLLGVRQRGDDVEIDPVLPPSGDAGDGASDGPSELTARLPLAGTDLTVRYVVGREGHGVRRVTVDGRELSLRPLTNPYRRAGAAVRTADLLAAAAPDGDRGSHTQTTTEILVETH